MTRSTPPTPPPSPTHAAATSSAALDGIWLPTRTRRTWRPRGARLMLAALAATMSISLATPPALAQRGRNNNAEEEFVPPRANAPRGGVKTKKVPYIFAFGMIVLIVVPNVLSSKRSHQD